MFSLDTTRIAYIGLRDVDPEERATLDDLNIPSFSMREVDEFGIREVSMSISYLLNNKYREAYYIF